MNVLLGLALLAVVAIGAGDATGHPALTAVAAVLLAAGWYVGRASWFPLGPCWRCRGEGKFRSLGGRGRTWRLCRRCRGTGSRVRFGRRVYDRLHTAHQREKRAAK